LRDFKSYSTKEFIPVIESQKESRKDWILYLFRQSAAHSARHEEYNIWTDDNHPEEIFSYDFMMTKLNYIHQNPVRAGLVANEEDYLYSSSSNYATGKGRMEIDFLF
jgi:hypothetical protein